MEAHPELEELEEGGTTGSAAPSAAESTPQPSGTRIKIITSASRGAGAGAGSGAGANGASSAAQSDEEK